MKSSEIVLRTLDVSNIIPFSFQFKKNIDYQRYKLNTTLHWHDHYEMEYISAGRGIHIINGMKYEISRGSAYFVTPTDFHTVYPVSDDTESQLSLYNFRFGDNLLPELLFQTLLCQPSPAITRFDEDEFSRLLQELEDVRHEYKEKRPFRTEMLYGSFERITIRFYRNLLKNSQPDTAAEYSGITSPVIQRAVAFIRYNFKDEALSPGMVAERFHLSHNYFGTLFSKNIGVSCNTYITQLRLDFARGLLVNSDLPVSEIGQKCGYSSPSYFIREFNARNGVTPTAYRKKYRAGT